VYHIKREKRHRVTKNYSTKSYHPLLGWFYGLKLHLVTDLYGNICDFYFTTVSTFDGTVLPVFIKRHTSKTYIADSAYLSQEYQKLALGFNSKVLAKTRKNMKKIASFADTELMNRRKIIESSISSLKDKFNLVTSLPRSLNGCLAHYIRCLFQYTVVDLDKFL
jgi:Transposase DDE domain